MGGSGKAEGFADGGCVNHRQAALAAATRRPEISRTWDVPNDFGGGTPVFFHGLFTGSGATLKLALSVFACMR